ncbi:MAG: GDP-mannose 4,6-dehydratase [Thermaerobacter sp.]|nr:GDP-mannose 4,6-dehydratase [Thermaerobacter sp.]
MRVLVTGATGFVGTHLVPRLEAAGHEVWGTHRPGVALAAVLPRVRLLPLEVADPSSWTGALARARPEAVVHLAGYAAVGRSWEEPREAVRTNVLGTLNLLEAVRAAGMDPVILSIGSGDEYGAVEELPVREDTPARPGNPYAVSKLAQGLLALEYHRRHGMRVVHLRPFNHIGAGQAPGFLVSDLARQIALMEAGRQELKLRVGNLDTARDYLDVRDVAAAYALALAAAEPGQVYNVASGRARTGREILQGLLALTSLRVEVTEDPRLFRPSDTPVVVGDAGKFRAATGWRPRYRLEESLRSALDGWRGG